MGIIIRVIFDICALFNVTFLFFALLFLKGMPKRKRFGLRALLFIPYIVFFNFKMCDIIHVPAITSYMVINNVKLSYMFIFIVAFLLLLFCFDCSFMQCLFYCVAAYIAQNFSNKFVGLFLAVTGIKWNVGVYIYAFINVSVGLLCSYTLIEYYRKNSIEKLNNTFNIVFSVVSIFIISIVSAIGDSHDQNTIYTQICYLFIDIVLLSLQCGLFSYSKAMGEKATLEKLLSAQEKKYKMSAENVEAINRKCHDLKYRLYELKKSKDMTDGAIKELKDEVMLYDAIAKTGNEPLDILLTERCFVCERKNISFSYIADGEILDFMENSDVYTLFGNILDNAIEASEKMAEEKRVIFMHIFRKEKLINIAVENYYNEPLDMVDGLPKTVKSDKENHGFGLKSIRYIVQKYGGELYLKQINDTFSLSILFFAR